MSTKKDNFTSKDKQFMHIALNLAIEFLDDNKFIDARIENQIILDD